MASWPAGRVTEETARIPSAVAATLTVLFAFATLRRFLGSRQAFVAALLLPVSFLWLDKAPSAEIDMLQLAWVSTALFFFLRAYMAKENGRDGAALGAWLGALLCVTGGFLTKWTAPAFFYLAVGPFLFWRGRWQWLFGREHLFAAGLAIALCSSWAVLVSVQVGWNTLLDTVSREAGQRFAPKANGKPYPWLESLAFPLIVIAANLPWSLPALFALRRRFLDGLEERPRVLVQLLHCWAWPNLLFWSLPAQHNVRYVLPLCPAISLLGAIVLIRWAGGRASRSYRFASPGAMLASALFAWLALKVVFVEAVLRDRTANRHARQTGQQIARLVPEGQILYLCRLKDEGVLFYYGRPARRLDGPIAPDDGEIYALLMDAEWEGQVFPGRPEYIAEFRDQQKAAIHLVRIHRSTKDDSGWPAQRFPFPTQSSPSAP